MFVAFGLLRAQHVVRTSVVRVVAMGLRNHFNILGRRAFFPRVQCPHYVTQRDVERNNCSLEQVISPDPTCIREGVATPD